MASNYTADSLKVCRLCDIAKLMNSLEAERDAALTALRAVLSVDNARQAHIIARAAIEQVS